MRRNAVEELDDVYRLDRPNAPMSYVTASKEGGSNLTDRVAGSELIDDASLFDMMSTTSSSTSSVASNENILFSAMAKSTGRRLILPRHQLHPPLEPPPTPVCHPRLSHRRLGAPLRPLTWTT